MKRMHKLVATPSSEAQRAFADYTVDRLSDLPLDVALHIPSFLNFKDLIRLSSVSKRCREFYLRTPSLKFSSLGTGNRQRQLNLMNCIDRYMACRRNDSIKCFRICWDFCGGLSEESFRMLTWILIAVRCNVEVLHLSIRNICNSPVLELSHYIFRCGSLKSLTIDINTILSVPSFTFFSNLQFLKLANVILDEGFGKWISCSCKSIKELHLNSVKVKEFTIDSSSLESFTVEPCYDFYHLSISGVKLAKIKIEWRFYDTTVSTTRSLNVKAPNLKYFQWVGNLLNYQNLGKLMSLEKSRIFLKHKGDDYDMDNAVKVLCSLCKVKALILSEETTKVLLREGSMHAPLDEIKYLGLHIMSLTDDLVPGVVSLLRGMPNLKTLYINSYPSLQRVGKQKACGFNRKYWKTQKLDCVHQLQEVSIALSLGYTNNALELARYILEHAPNLKKMVICYLSRQFFVEEKVKKMKKLSSAAVVFMEREVDEHDRMGESYYWDLHRS